jgi:hypothetical protein
MKKTFKIISIIFALSLFDCANKSNPYQDLTLPDKSEYSKILRAILTQDTIFINQGLLKSEYIGVEMTNLNLDLNRPKADTTREVIIRFPDFKTSILELNYYHITDSIHRSSDSLFFAFQSDILKIISIDSNIVNVSKFATKEMKAKSKGKPGFGYFQFSIPVLNKQQTKAFVQADFLCFGLCGQGMTYVLEKTNNKWTLKLAKTRWVS